MFKVQWKYLSFFTLLFPLLFLFGVLVLDALLFFATSPDLRMNEWMNEWVHEWREKEKKQRLHRWRFAKLLCLCQVSFLARVKCLCLCVVTGARPLVATLARKVMMWRTRGGQGVRWGAMQGVSWLPSSLQLVNPVEPRGHFKLVSYVTSTWPGWCSFLLVFEDLSLDPCRRCLMKACLSLFVLHHLSISSSCKELRGSLKEGEKGRGCSFCWIECENERVRKARIKYLNSEMRGGRDTQKGKGMHNWHSFQHETNGWHVFLFSNLILDTRCCWYCRQWEQRQEAEDKEKVKRLRKAKKGRINERILPLHLAPRTLRSTSSIFSLAVEVKTQARLDKFLFSRHLFSLLSREIPEVLLSACQCERNARTRGQARVRE